MTASAPPPDCLARPRDFDARYGDGIQLGLCLGGGGLFFVAWQLSYLHEMAERGIDLSVADRVVGTSAGALVASAVTADRLSLLYRELTVLAKAPKVIGALAPSDDLHPSQVRALELFRAAGDAHPETVRAIGHAALAARTPPTPVMARTIGLVLAMRKWPSSSLDLTCTDAYSGERCVITEAANIGIGRAVAASSAVPGLFAPQPIGDRRCMDGAVSGSGTHLDLLAGSGRVVVLALTDGTGIVEGIMTTGPGETEKEHAALEATGTSVFRRVPRDVDPFTLMDPKAVPLAIEMGQRQADEDADELRSFLGSSRA
ncbi:MAG TPA: patatin-like phospholipase family protein [Acidimicrobiales bacterium]|nr:patatin-like phospholipase family protein [Acidimicrobiales bacterium]